MTDAHGRSVLDRAQGVAEACEHRGEIGMIHETPYPPCGRVMVPALMLADLVKAARR